MPIYTVDNSSRTRNVKPIMEVFISDDSNYHNGGEGDLGREPRRTTLSFMEMTEADRQQQDRYSWRGNGLGSKQDLINGDDDDNINNNNSKPESIITREIREALEREAEISAMRRSRDVENVTSWPGSGNQRKSSELVFSYDDASTTASRDSFYRGADAHNPGLLTIGEPSGNMNHSTSFDKPRTPKHVSFVDEVIPDAQLTFAFGETKEQPPLPAAHPGESLIMREMLEQQRREEELKMHWKSIGVDVTVLAEREKDEEEEEERWKHLHDGDKLADNDSRNDLLMYHHHTSQDADVKSSIRRELEELKPTTAKVVFKPAPDTTDLIITDKSTPQYSSSSTSSHYYSGNENTPRTPRSLKVQPIFDGEGEDHADREERLRTLFVPQSETPIEREVRLAAEREEALRRSRGMPSIGSSTPVSDRGVVDWGLSALRRDETDHYDQGSLTTVEVSLVPSGRYSRSSIGSSSTYGDREGVEANMAMKKFAESRLQVELKREKEREIALRRQGSIHTISEDHVGEPVKFVEIISPETERALQALAREKTLAKSQRQQEAAEKEREREREREQEKAKEKEKERIKEDAAESNPPTATSLYNSRHSTGNIPSTVAFVDKHTARSSYAGTEPYKAPVRAKPKVLITYGYAPKPLDEPTCQLVSSNAAEKRIEQEVAEVKRREEELRKLHETLRMELGHLFTAERTKGINDSTSPSASTFKPTPPILLPPTITKLGTSVKSISVTPDFTTNEDNYEVAAANLRDNDGSAAQHHGISPGIKARWSDKGSSEEDHKKEAENGGSEGVLHPGPLALIREWENRIVSNTSS